MAVIAPVKQIQLFPWQYQAMKEFQKATLPDGTVQRFFGAFCGTGAGKSFFGAAWTLDQHIKTAIRLQKEGSDRPPLGLIVAPTYRHLERHAVGSLIEIVRGTQYAGEYSGVHGEYRFPIMAGRGKAYCGSAERPTSLEGAHVDYVWVDEAGLTPDFVWPILRARTQITQAPILCTSYWYSLQWCYTQLWMPFEAGDKSIKILNFPSTANPNIDPTEFERIRNVMDSRLFQMRHEGRPSKMVGLVYAGAWDEMDTELYCEPFKIPKDWPCWLGIDQGYSPSPFACLFFAENPTTGVVYVFASHRATAKLSKENATAITQLAQQYGVTGQLKKGWADPANKQGLADLRAALREVRGGLQPLDIRLLPADNAVESGIERVYEAFRTKRLRIMRGRCPSLVKELGLYRRDDDGDVVKEDDHDPDALRYGFYSAMKAKQKIVVV